MNKRQCPCNGCTVIVKAGLLMCAPHWSMVPKTQRDRVWSTWRAAQAAIAKPSYLELMLKYRAAADLAVSQVNAKLATTA